MTMAASVLESVRETDFVEYFLFPEKFDDKSLPEEELKSARENKLQCIRSLADEYTTGYIWHKDSVNLNLRDSSNAHLVDDSEIVDQDAGPHVHGVTHYGDNIDDEWFVVALLLRLTARLDGLVARVTDSDGEFLLIEAAEFLPMWASPEACTGRVFLYQGAVHLIPPTRSVAGIREAVRMVRDETTATLADGTIQQAVAVRTEGYPERARLSLHRARVVVPAGVAALLSARPALVAPAVRAFCQRDALDAKVCRAMRFFPPESSVASSVVFTRCLYAALRHAPFTPDRRTGWNVPPPSDPEHLPASLGVKLACGFEILMSDSKKAGGSERGWHRYLEGLEKRGYFKDVLEGSAAHTARAAAAREYFDARRDVIEPRRDDAGDVATLLDSLEVDIAALRCQANSLPPSDDESWLQLTPGDVDAMLDARYGRAEGEGGEGDVATRLTAFLSHVSALEGAEFPSAPVGPVAPIPPPRRKKEEKARVESINFDGEAFSCAVNNILDLVVPEDDWASEGSMSSYDEEDGEVAFDPARSELKQYMDQMDRELCAATRQDADFADVEDFKPVDVDMSAVESVLESFHAQLGGPGPAGNLLGPMGVRPRPPPQPE